MGVDEQEEEDAGPDDVDDTGNSRSLSLDRSKTANLVSRGTALDRGKLDHTLDEGNPNHRSRPRYISMQVTASQVS